MKLLMILLIGFFGGLCALILSITLVKPAPIPTIATVDMVALTKSRIHSLAQANLPETEKMKDMQQFEKTLTRVTNAYAKKNHLILLNKPAVIASSRPIVDITDALFKYLPPNHETKHG